MRPKLEKQLTMKCPLCCLEDTRIPSASNWSQQDVPKIDYYQKSKTKKAAKQNQNTNNAPPAKKKL